MSEGDAPQVPRHTLADKLNFCFQMVRHEAEDREYTGKEVVAAVNAAGTDLSASHLSELRRGIKTNPTARVLAGLAAFFQVRVGYFFDDPEVVEQVESELELRSTMRDAQVQDVARRVAGLDPKQRGAMNRLLADLLRQHGDADDSHG